MLPAEFEASMKTPAALAAQLETVTGAAADSMADVHSARGDNTGYDLASTGQLETRWTRFPLYFPMG